MTRRIACLKYSHTSIAIALGVSIGFVDLPSSVALGSPGMTDSTALLEINLENQPISVTFEPPNDDEPKNTVSGASRDGGGVCLPINVKNAQSQPTALEILPVTPPTNYGLTVADRPTFYAYIPQSDRADRVFFSIRTREHQTIYQTEFDLSHSGGGIIHVSLPADAPPLEMHRDYQWSMVLMCDGKMRPDSPQINAWVKRVDPLPMGSMSNGNQTDDLEVAALYAQHGIWYDTVNILANLLDRDPQTSKKYAEQWANFLTQDSVGLEAIATQPLLEKPLLAEHE